MMMGMSATHDDAKLILKLYDLRREQRLREARDWFVRHFHCKTLAEFNALCPPGSQENGYARMVTSYWEMVASFITADVLDQDLFFQSGQELLLVWTRVKRIVPELRHVNKNPHAYLNLEKVATAYIGYWDRSAPGAYEAFEARMASMAPSRGRA
jgi:hypothetical protein